MVCDCCGWFFGLVVGLRVAVVSLGMVGVVSYYARCVGG